MTVLEALWPGPPGVRAFTTLRTGGLSPAPFDSLNLGAHVDDDPALVAQNRSLVAQSEGWTRAPVWLTQVHGTAIHRADLAALAPGTPETGPVADGSVTRIRGLPLAVLTADCLPVVACDRQGTVVGAFHAGWKGLLNGVLEAGLGALGVPAAEAVVWIGPAIGAASYQVGPEVRDAFLASSPGHEGDFAADGPGRWRFDLAGAAARRLRAAGVGSLTLSAWDTLARPDLWFSHRRQTLEAGPAARCGRQATFIVLEDVDREEKETQ